MLYILSGVELLSNPYIMGKPQETQGASHDLISGNNNRNAVNILIAAQPPFHCYSNTKWAHAHKTQEHCIGRKFQEHYKN